MYILDGLTMADYRSFRQNHPGPLSKRSFRGWKLRGGRDRENFVWNMMKPNYKKMYHIQNKKIKQQKQQIYLKQRTRQHTVFYLNHMTVQGHATLSICK